MRLPDNILQQLVIWCQEKGISLAQVGNEEAGLTVLVLAEKEKQPDVDFAFTACAHILLTTVLTGDAQRDNHERKQEDDTPIPKMKVN